MNIDEDVKLEKPREKFITFFALMTNVIIVSIIAVCCSATAILSCNGYDGEECIDGCGLGEVEKCNWVEMKCKEKK